MKKKVFALFLLAWTSLAWSVTAGKVDLVEGDVRVLDVATTQERPLKLGDIISEGDTVMTGSKGELHLAMEDGGQLALRPNTRMQILKYKAEGGKNDTSVFNLLQGAMRSVTGWIGKFNARNYQIRTSTATIGVRGTDHETRVIPQGSSEGEAGTYDKVNIGATQIRTKFGATQVSPNQAGFVPASERARPRLLAGVPAFFRPMQHDRRFEGLHDRIRQRMDENRGKRIKEIVEHRREARKLERQKKLETQQLKRQEKAENRTQRKVQKFESRNDRPLKLQDHSGQREVRRESFMERRQPTIGQEPRFGRGHGRRR